MFRLTAIQRPNAINDQLTYEASDVQTGVASVGAGGSVASIGYTLDANGTANSMTDALGTSNFARDPAGQLVSATYAGAAFASDSFQYDGAGNRTASSSGTLVYDSANHLISDPTATYQF